MDLLSLLFNFSLMKENKKLTNVLTRNISELGTRANSVCFTKRFLEQLRAGLVGPSLTIPVRDFAKAKDAFSRVRGRFWKMMLMMFYLGAGQKEQGGWAGAFQNVVVRKHMTHPFHLAQN